MESIKKLEMINISKTFFSEKKSIDAVKNVSFVVRPGEFVCLLGPSGCGKTTLLRMIAGFEIPTNGTILLDGKDVSSLTPDKRDTAMVFQNYALFPHMNVFDNIAYGLKIQKRSKEEIKSRVHDILDLMKMEGFATRVPSQLSGGQQQRVSLARALIMNSGVLLFDEPLSNLDAKLRVHMRDEIRKIQQQIGITSIYVTHDQEEAMALADTIILMKDGEIDQVGSAIEIYQKPRNEFVAKFIGRANILQGQVTELKGKDMVVNVLGVEYSISVEQSERAYTQGDSILLVARPESADFSARQHTGRVTKSQFMGDSHEYEVEIEGQSIELSVSHPQGKRISKINDELHFGFYADTLHIM